MAQADGGHHALLAPALALVLVQEVAPRHVAVQPLILTRVLVGAQDHPEARRDQVVVPAKLQAHRTVQESGGSQ